MAARSAFVIDDSKSARFALRRYLENMSYVVETAESAETAFTYLKDHHPDVIFLDHVMPGVDGFDVLNSIKSDPRTIDIPVIICSSNEGDAFTQEARFKGAADVLSKPPTPQQLARVLGVVLGSRPAAPAPAAPKPAAPAPSAAPTPSATPAAAPTPTAAAAAAPRLHPDALLERATHMLEQLIKATADLAHQVAEIKAHVSKFEPRGEAGAHGFAKFRARVLKTKKPRLAARHPGRPKLPRR
jgi:CheY-like chemotaxis protein